MPHWMEDCKLLRVFIDASDTHGRQPLHMAIIAKARELGLCNAAVFRSPMGFGSQRRMHDDRWIEYVTDVPVVVEVVESEENVTKLLEFVNEAIPEGLVSIQDVKLIRHNPPGLIDQKSSMEEQNANAAHQI